MQLDRSFWEARYDERETGWDIGGPSTPLTAYIDQLKDKDVRILIPGAGRAYEAEYAHRRGSTNVFVIDLTDAPLHDLLQRCPDFPRAHFIIGDFFDHQEQYDVILEQTFFCALDPALRKPYVEHMHRLLSPGGELVGVLFNDPLNTDKPPFGGSQADYLPLFARHFPAVSMEPCYNSIPPRAGRELWLKARRSADYVPIDCSLYDRYEEAATLKHQVELGSSDGSIARGVIVDLFIRDAYEWMRLDHGAEIRLDRITSMRKV